MKKYLLTILAVACCFTACNKDSQPVEEPAEEEMNINDYKSDYSYDGVTAIIGVSDQVVLQMIETFTTLPTKGANEDTDLLIVGNLSQANDASIEEVYTNGGTIAVIHPKQDDVDIFFARHPDWNGYWEDDDMDDAVLYSFSPQGACHIITAVDDPDCFSFEPEYEPTAGSDEDFPYGDNYVHTAAVTDDGGVDDKPLYTAFETWFATVEDIEENGTKAQQHILDVAEEQKINVSDILSTEHYGKSYPFTAEAKLRHVAAWCDYDKINGSGSITTSLDMYKIHGYNGSKEDEGDYYLCYANSTIANGNMYKGKWWNKHFAIVCVFVRICGFICQEFNFGYTPLHPNSTKDNMTILTTDRVTIPANGAITPRTTPQKTKITDSKNFGLKIEGTAGTSAKGSKSGPEASKDAKVTVGANWGWSRNESYEISDAEVVETTANGNDPSHKIIFGNLPEFKWSSKYGFDEGHATSFKSTIGVLSSWVWRDKDGLDDSEEPSIKYLFTASAKYKAMSFKTTKADLEEPTFTFGQVSDVYTIKDIDRDCAGAIVVNNNSGKTINHIKLFNAAGQLVYSDDNSFTAGKQVDLGGFKTKYKYTMTLKIGDVEYKYSQNEYIPMQRGKTTTLNVADDFKSVK